MLEDPTSAVSAAGLAQQVEALTDLTQTLEERVLDLYTICQVGMAFSGDDPAKICEVLVSAMADRVGARRALVLLAAPTGGAFRPVHWTGMPDEEVRQASYHPRLGVLWQLVQAGHPFGVHEISSSPQLRHEFQEAGLDRLGFSYWVPLQTEEEVLGLVALDRACRSEGEVQFVYLLAGQAATALDHARVYQELQSSRRELSYQMNKLAMLYDVGRALNVIDDRNRLLTEILGRAAAIAEAERGSIMLFDETSDELVVQVVRGIDPETERKILNGEVTTKRLKRGEGVAGQVAASGKPLVVNNVGDGSDFVMSQTSRVSSILCVPLRVHGDVFGVLNITNKVQGKTFTDDDLQIILQVADQAAVAIHNARLYEMAVTDSLTRLYIRRHLFHRLNEEMRRARRYGHPVTVLMVDIDHFKMVNDTYGHPFGDKVLIEVSRVLRRSVRETDLLARYGGEEFCMVLPETDLKDGLIVARRMHSLLEAMDLHFEGTPLKITVSGGLASFPSQASNVEELIRAADCALYYSKRNGRDQTALFSPEHLLHARQRHKAEDSESGNGDSDEDSQDSQRAVLGDSAETPGRS